MYEIFADLHIHIGRSENNKPIKITAARSLNFANIAKECADRKGINIAGIIDSASPYVIEDIENFLKTGEAYEIKDGGIIYKDKVCIILGSEIETSEKGLNGHTGSAHNLCYFPYLSDIKGFSNEMSHHIKNITLSSQRADISAYELIDIVEKYNGIFCDKLIIEPLKKMLSDAKQQGINLTLTKGYVTVEEQDKLYNNKVKELMSSEGLTIVKAEAEAKKTVPPGNYSESQTGLSVGISTSKDISNSDFIQTDAYKWLSNNCINYGFIIRYPESKEKETGMEFDPTYYRFVGVDAAKKMRVLDMCLDEYYNYINSR